MCANYSVNTQTFSFFTSIRKMAPQLRLNLYTPVNCCSAADTRPTPKLQQQFYVNETVGLNSFDFAAYNYSKFIHEDNGAHLIENSGP